MERQLERCCGLDVHKETIVACVRVGGATGKPVQQVQTFGTTAGQLLVLRDRLAAHGMTHVAMERDLTRRGQIVAVCRVAGVRQTIPLRDLPLPSPPPAGAEWIRRSEPLPATSVRMPALPARSEPHHGRPSRSPPIQPCLRSQRVCHQCAVTARVTRRTSSGRHGVKDRRFSRASASRARPSHSSLRRKSGSFSSSQSQSCRPCSSQRVIGAL